MRWRQAMELALYGPDGFFVRDRPAGHFRTSATASPLFAGALATLLTGLDEVLGQPRTLDVVDVGAGRGELLAHLLAALPEPLRARVRPVAVEVAPFDPPAGITAVTEIPERIDGLLLATEWLDNVPLDLARDGRYLHADGSLGDPLDDRDSAWAERWWPVHDDGEQVEIGRTRDEAWAAAVAGLRTGLAVAVDYGHLSSSRPGWGSLTGFRHGREVHPALDGSTDITCHVAMDSAARAGREAAGGIPYTLVGQREALRALGVGGARPPLALASADPVGYLRALSAAGEAAELTDPNGLGGHWWLLQPSGEAGEQVRQLVEQRVNWRA